MCLPTTTCLLNNADSSETGQLLCSNCRRHCMDRRADLPSFAYLQWGRHGRLLRTPGYSPRCDSVSNQHCSLGLLIEVGSLAASLWWLRSSQERCRAFQLWMPENVYAFSHPTYPIYLPTSVSMKTLSQVLTLIIISQLSIYTGSF